MKITFIDACDLNHRSQRQGVEPLTRIEQQGLNDGQGERHLEIKRGSDARAGLDIDRSFEPLQHGLDYIHADAASRDLCDGFRSAEAGMEDEIKRFLFGKLCGLIPANNVRLDGPGDNLVTVDTAPLIADLNDHLIALVLSSQPQFPVLRLAVLD